MKFFSKLLPVFSFLLCLCTALCRSDAIQWGPDRKIVAGWCRYQFDLSSPRDYTLGRSVEHLGFWIMRGQKHKVPYTSYSIEFLEEDPNDWSSDGSTSEPFHRTVFTINEENEEEIIVQISYSKLMNTTLPQTQIWRYQGEYDDLNEPIVPGELHCLFDKITY